MAVSFSANDPSGFVGKKIKAGFARFLTQEAACAKALGLFSQRFRSDLDQDISSLPSPPGGNSTFILPQSRELVVGTSSQAGNALWNFSITVLPSSPGFKFIFLSNDTLEGRESQRKGVWLLGSVSALPVVLLDQAHRENPPKVVQTWVSSVCGTMQNSLPSAVQPLNRLKR